jgi:hypothetical protein
MQRSHKNSLRVGHEEHVRLHKRAIRTHIRDCACIFHRCLLMAAGFAGALGAFALSAGIVATPMAGPRPAWAGEGMWTMDTLSKCPFDQWKSKGLALGPADIYNPQGVALANAVVQIGGGTGSFVSPKGLILTNHHVAFSALQRQSSVKVNYMQEGFLARKLEDEIPALGYEVRCILDIKDVTKEVLAGVKDNTPDKQRHDKIEANIKKIVQNAEKGKDVEATVRAFYDGAQYSLYTYFKIKDVRIVYAPPEAIGNYGGDIDNWIWPRHTGDFSFLRAYVAPDGKSAEYAKENVPFKPKKYLAFSIAPLKEGDLTMVIGFPGSTRRYRCSYEIDYTVNEYYPRAIAHYRGILDILEAEAKVNPDAAIRTASTVQGFNNGYKNNVGMLEGLKKANLLGMKVEEDKALRAFMEANPEMKKKYGRVLDGIAAEYNDYRQWSQVAYLGQYMSYTPVALRVAYTIVKWDKEHEKKNDLDRDPGFQDRDEPRIKKGLEIADLQYNESADKKVLAYYFMEATKLPEGQRVKALEPVIAGLSGEQAEHAIQEFVEKLYAGTKVTTKDERMKMFGMKTKDLAMLKDAMIDFAAALEVQRKELEDKTDAFDGAMQRLRPELQQLRQAQSGALLYPDANGTMRLSIGEIRGYSPRDAVTYNFQTRLKGVIEKDTGEEPFDCPDGLLKLFDAKDFGAYADPALKDVPVCFLSTDDITGGNSGSPIFNGKGDVIGVIFDGNIEAVSADYYFMPDLTRSISVDARYILFVVDKFAGAKELLGELTVR